MHFYYLRPVRGYAFIYLKGAHPRFVDIFTFAAFDFVRGFWWMI